MVKSLSLKEFVREALIDINTAVNEAAEEGVSIVYNEYKTGQYPKVQTVSFDLAVTVEQSSEENNKKDGGFRISVFNAKVGSNKNELTMEKNINRISFSVEVFLGLKES